LIKERLEMYKGMYYYELDIKEKINSRISLPLGIIILLLGGGFCFIKDMFDFTQCTMRNIYIILLISYIIFVIGSIISLINSYYGYEYHYLPETSVIEKYIEDVKEYYNKNYEEYFSENSCISKECLIENEVSEFLIKNYISTAEHDQKMNFNKLTWQRHAITFIIIAILTGAINLPIYFNLKSQVNIKPVKVEIKQNVSNK
jgi:hypothetical protein